MITFKNGHPDEKTDIPDGDYYTVPELAEKLDVSQVRIRQWIQRGNLAAVNFYGRNYIPKNFTVGFSRTGKKLIQCVSSNAEKMHKSKHKFETTISV